MQGKVKPRYDWVPERELNTGEQHSIILAGFSGASPDDLAEEYGVSRSWVCKLLDAAHAQGRTYIYGLIDPRDKKYFYVGLSDHPERRLIQHVRLQGTPSQGMRDKLGELAALGIEPELRILESVDIYRASDRENFHMDALRSNGMPLLNKVKHRPGRRITLIPEISSLGSRP